MPSQAVAPLPAIEPESYSPRVATSDEANRALALYDQIAPATGELTPTQRGAAIREIVKRTGMALRTVQRHVKAYNAHGLEGLMRKRPSTAGEARCAVSIAFDRAFIAAGHSPALLPDLGDHVDQVLKGLWKSRAADAGENDVRQLADFLLWERCAEIGAAMPKHACKIGRRRVRQWRHYSIVNMRNNDAKAFRNTLPAITRDWTGLDPMQIVVADVKHLDVMVTRENGAKAYPKLIGFMDGGTGRIFSYLVLCPERRSITQKLVIEAFIAMANDHDWGLPRQLYLDNGSEFGGLDRIIPALALINGEDGREIVRAQPYNAQAKPIEGLFARLDRYCFSSLPGYTGGDRTNKKTQNDGREPDAWTGTWESFVATVGGLIDYYHQREIGGQWQGRSPNQLFAEKIGRGWRPIHAKPFALEIAFCERKTVKLSKFGLRHAKVRYWHPEFAALPGRSELELLLPWREGEEPIAMLPNGRPVKLTEDYPYPANDFSGGADTGRRKQSYKRAVARPDDELEAIDPTEVKLRMARDASKPAIPGRPRYLDQGASIHELAPAGRLIENNPTPEIDEAARQREAEKRRTERLIRAQKAKGQQVDNALSERCHLALAGSRDNQPVATALLPEREAMPYIETSVLRRMVARMQKTHDRRRASFFVGPPGIGKSTAIEAFRAANPQNVAVTQILKRGVTGPRNIAAALACSAFVHR
ncbi:MAG: helix-turn-helix domain-containing protein [Sphingomonadaceae bacterium]